MEVTHQLAALLGVFVLLGAVLLWLRKRGLAHFRLPGAGMTPRRPLQVAARLALGPQQSLQLIRVADQGFVLAVHSGGCTLLASRPWVEFESRAESTVQPLGGSAAE